MLSSIKKIFSYLPLLVAVLSALFVYWFLGIYGEAEVKRQRRESEEILHRQLDQNRSTIEQKITGQKEVARSLADYVEFNPKINQQIFSKWAKRIFINANSQSLTFAITQQDSLEINYPKGSNKYILFSLQKPGKREYPIQTDSINKIVTYLKPYLLNGEPAIVHQNYVYVDDTLKRIKQFWGNAVIVDDLKAIVAFVPFKNTSNRKFNLQVELEDGTELLQVGQSMNENDLFVSEYFKIESLTIRMNLGSVSLQQDLKEKVRSMRVLFISIAIVIALLNGYLIANMFSIQRKNKVLAIKNRLIKAQLSEKVLLIKEIHHRIKNHFQLISSLNRTSSERLKNKSVDEIIEEINGRIELMAKAYDQIGETTKVNNFMPDYLPSVAESLTQGIHPEIKLIYNITPLAINIKRTVYIGIILNELVINSIKHGFSDEVNDRTIKIEFYTLADRYILKYSANGKALPENMLQNHSNSTGTQILTLFTDQLDGAIVQIKEEEYTGFEIEFKV